MRANLPAGSSVEYQLGTPNNDILDDARLSLEKEPGGLPLFEKSS